MGASSSSLHSSSLPLESWTSEDLSEQVKSLGPHYHHVCKSIMDFYIDGGFVCALPTDKEKSELLEDLGVENALQKKVLLHKLGTLATTTPVSHMEQVPITVEPTTNKRVPLSSLDNQQPQLALPQTDDRKQAALTTDDRKQAALTTDDCKQPPAKRSVLKPVRLGFDTTPFPSSQRDENQESTPVLSDILDDDDDNLSEEIETLNQSINQRLSLWEQKKLTPPVLFNLIKFGKSYNKLFGECVPPGDFQSDSGDMIMSRIMDRASERESHGLNAKSALNSCLTAKRLLDLIGRPLSEKVNHQRLKLNRTLASDARKILANEGSANSAITSEDTRHIINTILNEYEGEIPTRYVELICRLVLSQTCGKRSIESLMVGPTSWQFKVMTLSSGKKIRTINPRWCYRKRIGACLHGGKMVQSTTVESDPTLWLLLLSVRRGMVQADALDIWNGKAEFQVDPNLFESSEELLSKLQQSLAASRNEGLCNIKKNLMNSCDNGNIMVDDSESGDDEQEPSQSEVEFCGALRKLDGQEETPKIPFYVCYTNAHILQLPTSQREMQHTVQLSLNRLARRCGYLPTKNQYFGIGCCRKNFRQNSRNLIGQNMDVACHLTIFMANGEKVGIDNYEGKADYVDNMVSNMAQKEVDTDAVAELIREHPVSHGFERHGFFRKTVKPRLEPLGDQATFLEKHACKSQVQKNGVNVSLFHCPAKTCSKRFLYGADLLEHIKISHGKNETFCCEVDHGKKSCYHSWSTYRNHIKRFCPDHSYIKFGLVTPINNGSKRLGKIDGFLPLCNDCHVVFDSETEKEAHECARKPRKKAAKEPPEKRLKSSS
mmetsp:Transcript_22607/g.47158  ORF Transcript_22607/g.47158 Transcript_22607/m.47158 type:complete len:831 (-) Transcript_22607:132-2624(-)|eukprot:CAMPEP_0172449500 /NCGR_PEP_ID=MMETSP1065-20121228/8192_1 /TAXON_ID=265537 /ORGANISM="Amphiprora paludosa, Strain CCMP125" /LENGTH=830 /DNA_ID=CAMNT_0013201187 /DNA_START=215 /DNA_END=2707 /DNA_ORIENTATION=-